MKNKEDEEMRIINGGQKEMFYWLLFKVSYKQNTYSWVLDQTEQKTIKQMIRIFL